MTVHVSYHGLGRMFYEDGRSTKMWINYPRFSIVFFLLLVCCFLFLPVVCAEDIQPAPVTADPTVTLELQGVNILDVFKILSKKSGLNIVAGQNVQGEISMFLQDVPVREALRTILQSQGLAAVEDGTIIKVMSEKDYLEKYGRPYEDIRMTRSYDLHYASAEAVAGKLTELKSRFGNILIEPRTNTLVITELPHILESMEDFIRVSDRPQTTKVFHLRYARVEDLETKLQGWMEGGLGKLEIDKRANRVVVVDIPSRIRWVRNFIRALDIQVPQVLIEAKIVEVRLNDSFRQGISWEKIIREISDAKTLKAVAPLAVSPPVGTATLAAFSLKSEKDNFSVVLDLLERVGKTNLLSSPRITVLNDEEAKLSVATREPFISQTVVQTPNSTNTADNVQFVDVGVTLRVRPRISHDDFVQIRIRPEVSSSNQAVELEGVAQGSNTTFTRTRIPVVTTQELDTTVLIKSGTTLVIGGLIQDRQEKQSSKVPLLGSIPLLGRAFQSRSHDFAKTELVTFLTPRIIESHKTSREGRRFFDRHGKAHSFEAFGKESYGTPYRTTYVDPLRYAYVGEIPYWEKPVPNGGDFIFWIGGKKENRHDKNG
ncbi:MAG: hypothetical protein NC930_06785 [Candidatus Omnitrophica bacterium]|nr:hypothetical protein [Candidatus Omnitrophota bacterium]